MMWKAGWIAARRETLRQQALDTKNDPATCDCKTDWALVLETYGAPFHWLQRSHLISAAWYKDDDFLSAVKCGVADLPNSNWEVKAQHLDTITRVWVETAEQAARLAPMLLMQVRATHEAAEDLADKIVAERVTALEARR
jgi:hypothetical protein